jgi:two-component system OmpR family response regulator
MDSACRIAIVSGDELWGIERVRVALSAAGYQVNSLGITEFERAATRQPPDLIIANLSGSTSDDLQMCELIRRVNSAPIVAIGSGADELFRVSMMEYLADDFLTRPINPRELVARVGNILRRTNPQQAFPKLTEGTSPDQPIQTDPEKTHFFSRIGYKVFHRHTRRGG